MRVLYLVDLYIDPVAVDAATSFGGNGRIYLMGALAHALTFPPKSILVHYIPQKPINNYHFSRFRLQFFRKSLAWDADAYFSLDADLICTSQFHQTVLENFQRYPCFGGVWEPRTEHHKKWLSLLQEVSRFVGKPSTPFKICGGVFGAIKPIWDDVTRQALSWFVNYYLKYPELRKEPKWGGAPTEEHFMTVAFAPYYFEGRLKAYSIGGVEDRGRGGKSIWGLEFFPDPTFRACSAHNQSRALLTKHLKETLAEYANLKARDALEIIRERQILLFGSQDK